ncbi:MAG: protein kinase [Deltaproteobacteria bacterium]|nr:protein kinase [Deltaproteobacteria bacterium]
MSSVRKPGRGTLQALLSPASLVGVEARPEAAERTALLEAPGGLEEFKNEGTRTGLGEVADGRGESDPWLGASLGGYRLERLIGSGSHARVYEARGLVEPALRRAIKVMRTRSNNRDEINRAAREVRVLESLDSPHIVRLHSTGVTSAGAPYHVLELLEGRTLARAVEDEPLLELERIVTLARDIASGLALAHAQGIVHRDLKPANIMLVRGPGRELAKILDFGVARWTEADGPLTRSGVHLGTPLFMAPEQITSARTAGPEADVYSLGVILFQLVRGRPPFSGSLNEVVTAHLREAPEKLDGPLSGLIGRMLQKDPGARPRDGAAVLHELDQLFSWSEATERADFGGESTEPTDKGSASGADPLEPTQLVRGAPTAASPSLEPESRAAKPLRPLLVPVAADPRGVSAAKAGAPTWVKVSLMIILIGAGVWFWSSAFRAPPVPEPSMEVVLELNGLTLADLDEASLRALVNDDGRAKTAEALASSPAIARAKLARIEARGGGLPEIRAQLARASTPEEVRLVTQRLYRLESEPRVSATEAVRPSSSPLAPASVLPERSGATAEPATTSPVAGPVREESPDEKLAPRAAKSSARSARPGRVGSSAAPEPRLGSRPAEREAKALLAELGLSLEDVPLLGLTDELSTLDAAASDPAALAQARIHFRAGAERAAISDEFLRARFDRLRVAFEHASGPDAEAAESEFLELRSRLSAKLGPGERRALNRKLSVLEARARR